MSSEQRVSKKLPSLIRMIDKIVRNIAGQRMGISLVIFNTTPGGRVNYISNCHRDEVKEAFKELIEAWDADMPDVPAHEVD